ncbi:MAG: hypothetical protein ACLQNG_04135 [Acidimicrobiales bacterium]
MNTLTGTAPTGAPSPVLLPGSPDAKLAWRRRVCRIGSLIQLGFAALWLGRGILATGWTGRLPLGLGLVAGAVALGVWGEARTRGLAPRPSDPAARQLERAVTVATVLQLGASFGFPFVVIALGRPDLVVGTVSVTIGILLLWLRARLRTPGHLVAGALLLVVPVGLALALAGNALTAATALAVAAVLVGSAAVGLGSLCHDPFRRCELHSQLLATEGKGVNP